MPASGDESADPGVGRLLPAHPMQQPAFPAEQARFLLGQAPMGRAQKEVTVYRVAPGPVNAWSVYAGPGREPVASFGDKSSAVRYAMCLARGELSWSPPPSALAGSRTASRTSPPA